ncbi:LamB/YcsF family protein [Anaerosphaera multitolerans]|uniref:5-oxoprolinase subunit A n=1 Tax=Anaerosphaera multitolerans TaxID=2487351 RepID=A0A437S906_9FIRM|nr:LamB/YcsF family protein [Anaerosphaera multitolerans]RVU55589.1 LamB/YcsF family protein [Anaerosphaera multitolerans]
MTFYVDLNSDIGEGFGAYTMGMDEEIIKHVTSINLACGWHAGDPLIMDKTVKMAKEYGVMVGAHPGYPDLMGFGRRNLDITPDEARCYMLYQTGALMAFTKAHGIKLQHMKMHGGFYNKACVDEKLANAVLDGMEALDKDVILMVLSGSYIAKEGKRRGLRISEEVFADRGYNPDGTLVNRSLPGAFVKDPKEAIPRVIKMIKEGKVVAANGEEMDIKADSICVHGDNPKAIEFVKEIKEGLLEAGIEIAPIDKFI